MPAVEVTEPQAEPQPREPSRAPAAGVDRPPAIRMPRMQKKHYQYVNASATGRYPIVSPQPLLVGPMPENEDIYVKQVIDNLPWYTAQPFEGRKKYAGLCAGASFGPVITYVTIPEQDLANGKVRPGLQAVCVPLPNKMPGTGKRDDLA